MIDTCAAFSIKAETTSCTGVWVGDKKLCSLGNCPLGPCYHLIRSPMIVCVEKGAD